MGMRSMRRESGVKVGENEVVRRNVTSLSYEVPYITPFQVRQVDITSGH